MSNSYLYRKLNQTVAAGAVETAFGAANEEKIYDLPNLHSWFTSDPAYFDGATGTYKDKGPRGNHWQQTDATKRPAQVANWRGTGYPAVTFDGVNDCIPALFHSPVGPLTLVVVGDSNSIQDADQTFIGSNVGNTTFTQYYLATYHGGIEFFVRFNNAGTGTVGVVGSVSNKLLAVANSDPVSGTLDCQCWGSVNSGTWFTYGSPAYAHVNLDATMQLGAYRTNQLLLPGNIAEALIFTGAMKGTADLDTVVNAMKAKYGIA